MQFILNMIKNVVPNIFNYWKYILIIIILILGLFSGYKITDWYYSNSITRLNIEISNCKSSYNTLVDFTNKQNNSILELKDKQKQKEEEIKIAQKKARDSSKAFYDEVNILQNKTIDNNQNACTEASKLIDTEIVKERLNK